MTTCEHLSDRMPDIAHGRDTLSATDSRHLAECGSCAIEWRVISAGPMIGAGLQIDADPIAHKVVTRLREPISRPTLLPRRWVHGLIGLAAAAAIAIVALPDRTAMPGAPTDENRIALFPELRMLTEVELQSVLEASDGPGISSAIVVPQLGDLTEDEMARLLRSLEG